MARTRRPYPPGFRQQMIELARAGRTPEELARDFEPSAQTIRNWVRQADRDEGRRQDGMMSWEREELRRLLRENRHLRMDREILAKATAGPSKGATPVSGVVAPPPRSFDRARDDKAVDREVPLHHLHPHRPGSAGGGRLEDHQRRRGGGPGSPSRRASEA